MDKVILIKKEKNYTSRDVVNIIGKIFNTKKVGHFGTLDPLAEGLLVVGIWSLTKLDNFDIFNEKEYIADVLVGTSTDTYDITGNVIEKQNKKIDKDELNKVINSFNKTYLQEVPIYSSVKVHGKKLYEYARNNENVDLPKKEVTISNIRLLDYYEKDNDTYFKFKATVSKGTYIRSLINDISKEIGIPLCMSDLLRTRVGKFNLDDAYYLEDIKNGNVNMLDIRDVLPLKEIVINESDNLYKRIINGNKIDCLDYEYVLFKTDKEDVVLYKKDVNCMRPCFFFKN